MTIIIPYTLLVLLRQASLSLYQSEMRFFYACRPKPDLPAFGLYSVDSCNKKRELR